MIPITAMKVCQGFTYNYTNVIGVHVSDLQCTISDLRSCIWKITLFYDHNNVESILMDDNKFLALTFSRNSWQ